MNARTLAQIQQIWYIVYGLTHRKVVPYVCHSLCGSSWLNRHRPWAFGPTSLIVALVLLGLALWLIVPVARRVKRELQEPAVDFLLFEQEVAIKEARLSELDAYRASVDKLFGP